MSILLTCPGCQSKLKAPDGSEGKTLTCPHCKHAFLVSSDWKANTPPIQVAKVLDQAPASMPEAANRSGLKYKKSRVAVWVCVMIWCFLPIIWLLVCLVISLFSTISNAVDARIKESRKPPPVVYVNPDEPAVKPPSPLAKPQWDSESVKHEPLDMLFLMGFGYAALVLLFGYGLWCSVGVICGQGCDRALIRLEELRS
jgi:hypothetical protein